jgi:hypothetical protein
MPAPITSLQIAQAGLETTRGTAVAATRVLDVVPGSVKPARDPHLVLVRRAGSLATAHSAWPGRDEPKLDLELPLSYDYLPFLLNLTLGPLTTPTGAGADKTWTFDSTVISDTADNLKSATIEVGGRDSWPSGLIYAGCVGTKLDLSAKVGEAWSAKLSVVPQSLAKGNLTTGLSVMSNIQYVLATGTKAYIDPTTFGTTQRATVLSAEISFDIGVEARWYLSGSRAPGRVAVTGPRAITAKIVAEWDSITEFDATHAATIRKVRLETTGATLGSSAYRFTLDLPGVWESHVLAADGGVITEELSLRALYDATLGADVKAVVVNASTSVL